ncbi:hypothetical protein BJ878DRAFT_552339 [Calycina marina]|uniref:Uncharacterized protein n=1 Tax=Calycina marina TaxID=1763456 RepID=A0A9P7Z1J2_9HELO|nr:hypothetical protein BJ878DRAFT_552339 [Calycina marina]
MSSMVADGIKADFFDHILVLSKTLRKYFPFGETPYQKAYQSWRMEQDLLDVEDLSPKPLRGLSLFAQLKQRLFELWPTAHKVDRCAVAYGDLTNADKRMA